MNQTTINQRIKILIDELGLNIGTFSRALDVGETNVRNYISRGSKPSSDFLEKVARHFERVNITWLLTGVGSVFSDEVADQAATHQKISNLSGINIGRNYGTATQQHATKEDCEKEVVQLRAQVVSLQGQLQDKQDIIDLQKQLLNSRK